MNVVQMKCPFCKAGISISPEIENVSGIYFCQYCGKPFSIDDGVKRSEHVYRKIDEARILEAQNEQQRIRYEQEKAATNQFETFKKGGFSKVIIAFFVICLFFTTGAFAGEAYASAIVGLIQTILFAAAWILGMGYIKIKNNSLYAVFAVIGFVLIIPFLMFTTLM